MVVPVERYEDVDCPLQDESKAHTIDDNIDEDGERVYCVYYREED
jgi:hypothetical protein